MISPGALWVPWLVATSWMYGAHAAPMVVPEKSSATYEKGESPAPAHASESGLLMPMVVHVSRLRSQLPFRTVVVTWRRGPSSR